MCISVPFVHEENILQLIGSKTPLIVKMLHSFLHYKENHALNYRTMLPYELESHFMLIKNILH